MRLYGDYYDFSFYILGLSYIFVGMKSYINYFVIFILRFIDYDV